MFATILSWNAVLVVLRHEQHVLGQPHSQGFTFSHTLSARDYVPLVLGIGKGETVGKNWI